MKTKDIKYIIGILAVLVLTFAAVATTNAVPGKKNIYKTIPMEGVTINPEDIISLNAKDGNPDLIETVEPDGTMKQWVNVKYYLTVQGDATSTYTYYEKVQFQYVEDPINPDNDNVLRKQAIINDAQNRFGISLSLQNLRYSKKSPGNQ